MTDKIDISAEAVERMAAKMNGIARDAQNTLAEIGEGHE